MNRLSNQEKQKKRKDNAFIEKFAYILAFVLLVFVGLSLFITPKEKYVFNFDKVNLNADESIEQEKENISVHDGVSLDNEINADIMNDNGKMMTNEALTQEQKKYFADIKRQKMQEKLRKQMAIAQNPRKLAHSLYKKNAPSLVHNTTPEIKGGVEYDYNMPSTPQTTQNYGQTSNNDYTFDLSASTCTTDEMEYVLNLYTSVNSRKPLTLPFRRNNPSSELYPEVINATLPNNKWRNLENEFEAVLGSIFGEIFKDESSNTNKTKVGALITTPCSDSAYVSEAFYVSDTLPQRVNASSARNYCSSRSGRLPDILEIIAILKHKNLPSGYYMTNSQIMKVNKNGTKSLLNDYVVMQYQKGDVYFTSSSKLPQNASVYGECVLK